MASVQHMAGFHLENLSRGGKMDSKIWGGGGGVWGHAPQNFFFNFRPFESAFSDNLGMDHITNV